MPRYAGAMDTIGDVSEALLGRIEARRDELVELTRELIRFPTVNPPGEGYVECAEFIGTRLSAPQCDCAT